MNSTKHIEQLYQLIKIKTNAKEARATVKAIIGNILDDLELEGKDVSEENICIGLHKYLTDFQQASSIV